MILGISQAGQIEPLGPLAWGVVVESAPLYACPKAGFILTCVRGGGTSHLSAGTSSPVVVAGKGQGKLFQGSGRWDLFSIAL